MQSPGAMGCFLPSLDTVVEESREVPLRLYARTLAEDSRMCAKVWDGRVAK